MLSELFEIVFSYSLQDFRAVSWPHDLKGLGRPKHMTETQPENRCLGYARANTSGQMLAAQLETPAQPWPVFPSYIVCA